MHNEVESSKGPFHFFPYCGQICTDMHDTDSYNEAANRLVVGVRSLDLFVLELQFRVSFMMQIECRGDLSIPLSPLYHPTMSLSQAQARISRLLEG